MCDAAVSVVVGTPRSRDLRLIETTRLALDAAIGRPGPASGSATSPTPSVPSPVAAGYRVNTTFGGHGVGRVMHDDPHVPNDGRRGSGMPLRPGLVIAIEPWFLDSTDLIYTDPDGWTLRSVGRLARRPLRAHRGDHRGRPCRADRALTVIDAISAHVRITDEYRDVSV